MAHATHGVGFLFCLQKVIDYLKMDVENAEWISLQALFQTDILQSKVKQFGLEIHLQPHNGNDMAMRIDVLDRLVTLGFRRWYIHYNRSGSYRKDGVERTCCYEMVYINSQFMRAKNST